MIFIASLLIGLVAGLRAMTAPAIVAWAAWLGWIDLSATWAAFFASGWAVLAFSIAALGEFVTDQLPTTPSRKVPPQFAARIASGGLAGAALGAAAGSWGLGLGAGIVGAVIGTLLGADARGRLAARFGSDRPAAFLEDAAAVVLAPDRRVAGMSERFDAIVIGGGQAGPSLAVRLASAGQSVAIVERRFLGGTCVNTGCRPTKTLIASAYAAHLARRAADFGIAAGPVTADMARVKARIDAIVLEARQGQEDWLRATPNVTLIQGHARLTGPRTVAVGDRALTAGRIFLNVGARAAVPNLPGVDRVATLNNSTLLALDTLPEHLVVVGGGYIGLEFAQAFRRLGAAVTVVEKGPRLIAHEDADIADAIREFLAAEGVTVRTGAECIHFAPRGDRIAVGVSCEDGAPEEIGSHVLLAMGRQPNTDDLGLDSAGVATDARGTIQVDDRLATSVPGIWALGECNGRGAFTHTAYNDYEIVAANLLDGADRRVTDRRPAYALFTDPPLGRAGMTEAEARASGRRVLVGTRPMTKVSRAVEKGETRGFIKVLADADTREILGAAILGTGGDEAIHAVLDLMYAGAPVETMLGAVHIHPTVSELLPTVFGEMRPLE